jgi:hypothetical protein
MIRHLVTNNLFLKRSTFISCILRLESYINYCSKFYEIAFFLVLFYNKCIYQMYFVFEAINYSILMIIIFSSFVSNLFNRIYSNLNIELSYNK